MPEKTKVLIAEVEKIGVAEPFSYEKLSPTLAMYRAKDFAEAVDKAVELVKFGGFGHTSVLYTDPVNTEQQGLFCFQDENRPYFNQHAFFPGGHR